MTPLGFLIAAAGLAVIVLGLAMIRGPRAVIRRLEETEADLRRYDAWRGRGSLDDGGPTGADVMKEQMRRRVYLWGGVIVVGAILVIVGVFVA